MSIQTTFPFCRAASRSAIGVFGQWRNHTKTWSVITTIDSYNRQHRQRHWQRMSSRGRHGGMRDHAEQAQGFMVKPIAENSL